LQCVAVCCIHYVMSFRAHICSVLQCVALRSSVLQCVAVCGSVLQCVAVCCSVLHCDAGLCSMLQGVAVRCLNYILSFQAHICSGCSVLQCVAVCCSVLQYDTGCCSVLQSSCIGFLSTHHAIPDCSKFLVPCGFWVYWDHLLCRFWVYWDHLLCRFWVYWDHLRFLPSISAYLLEDATS